MTSASDIPASDPRPGRLAGRLIGLGVTGSIAAYKAVDLLRRLQDESAEVVALLTPTAARFVGPLTFAALSRHPVELEITELLPDGRIGHIVIADSVDALVVAPATAHWLGAMANGLASDTVTAACLASAAPVVVAPAMDGEMYAHPATRENVRRLRDDFGYRIVEPESGPLASGQEGAGRLADTATIVEAVVTAIGGKPIREPRPERRPPTIEARPADLAGRRIAVTAGGTREPIDAVRFIGNRSSGRMGAAIAAAALERGAEVTLIAANTTAPLPAAARIRTVESTGQLRAAVLESLVAPGGSVGVDALIMAAAVADFAPAAPVADRKLVRGEALTLQLSPTPDILAEASRIARGEDAGGGVTRRPLQPRPILVGFAAEAGSVDRAPGKLARKQVDLIVANDITEPGSGFGSETNRVVIFDADGGHDELPLLSKREVADRILDRVVRLLEKRDAAMDSQRPRRQTGTAAEEGTA